MQRTTTERRPFMTIVIPAATAVLAIAAGAIHLAHNYLPMQAPSSGTGAPPPVSAGPSGLMGLVMPHLSQVMVLNFVAFVGLAVLLLVVARLRAELRVVVDVLLAALSVATLYAWNAMGRANPAGTGTLALIVELALMAVALGDAMWVAGSHVVSRRRAVQSGC